MLPELETTPQTIARPAIKPRTMNRPWAQIRFVTTISALLLIGSSAAWNIEVGTFSSLRLGPITIACPLGVAQVLAATQTFVPALALGGAAGIILTVLFGRAFCGWLCPGRWIFNRGPRTAPKPLPARNWVQGGIVAGVVGLAWLVHNPVFCVICPVGAVCRGAVAVGTGGNWLPTLGWLSALIGAEWLSGRSWCRDVCPVGAMLSRLSALNPFFKIKRDATKCRPCTACMKSCPENLNLSQTPDLSPCTKCFACQSTCPRDAVEIKFSNLK